MRSKARMILEGLPAIDEEPRDRADKINGGDGGEHGAVIDVGYSLPVDQLLRGIPVEDFAEGGRANHAANRSRRVHEREDGGRVTPAKIGRSAPDRGLIP